MTWSYLARDDGGALGVAIASRFFAVGALCPHARGGVGALATQALVNPLYARAGARAARARDAGRRGRAPAGRRRMAAANTGSCTSIDARGRAAAHTGSAVHRVVRPSRGATATASRATCSPGTRCSTTPQPPTSARRRCRFAERLLAALEAGDAAGGDKRGEQAAALADRTRPRPIRSSTCASTTTRARSPSCGASTTRASSASSRSSPACRARAIPRASPIAPLIEERDRALPGGASRAMSVVAEPRDVHRSRCSRSAICGRYFAVDGRRVRRGRRRELRAATPGARSASSASRAAARASPRCRSWAWCRSRPGASQAARSCSRASTS